MKQPGANGEKELFQAIERERRRIGEILHDELCQTLTGTMLLLETTRRSLEAGKAVSAETIALMKEAMERAVGEARSLSRRFNPSDLKGAGLMASLQELASATAKCELTCEQPVFIEEEEIARALFRIAQEAVENAASHAKAESIQIRLLRKDRMVFLEIQDDGRGFAGPADASASAGLELMRRRAQSIRGTLKIETQAGRGTRVSCAVPQRDQATG